MTALQSIIKEAKSLRAKYPKRFTKWTDYVKQASAIYAAKHKGKSPVVKKKVVKKFIAKKPTEKVILKKVHSAKQTSKNLFNKLDKLDEAQHEHMGALPIGFKGSILGVNFKVINQFDIYNNVSAIVEDIKNGSTIIVINGSSNIKNKVDSFESYIINHTTFNKKDFPKNLYTSINKFVTNLNQEVKKYNSGKKVTAKKKPLIIKKVSTKVITQKNTLTKIKDALRQDHKRLKGGYTMTKGKVRLGSIKMGNLPTYHDIEAAKEIQLFADNDYNLYRQQKRPILINLGKKYKKGTYKIESAAKLWKYYIDNALKKYNKDFGSRGDKWYDLLDMHDRNLLAHEFAIETKNEFDLGNFTEQ